MSSMTPQLRHQILFVPFIAIFIVLLNPAPALGQAYGRKGMKQLSPGNGWLMLQQHLYWTQNDGAIWIDITPPGPGSQQLREVRFVDSSHGWAVLYDPDGRGSLRIVSTANGGRTWKAFEFTKTSYFSFEDGVGGISLSFISRRRGWALFQMTSSSAFSRGALFTTLDGGKAWSALPAPPAAGSLEFTSTLDGWLAGGVDGGHLWVTHDGGESWLEKEIPLPDNCQECRIGYVRPVFRNSRDGVLDVLLDAPAGQKATAYITNDGGELWQIGAASEEENWSPSSVVGLHVIRASTFLGKGLAPSGENSTLLTGVPARGSIWMIDFADDQNGWALYVSRACPPGARGPCPNSWIERVEILSTRDGGSTFRRVTPNASPPKPN